MEADEARILAPFAQKSGESRGRECPEPRHAYRTEFQRDRARIIHARAFRRLEYKTQVFLNGTGDHLRTRLTHTMEVAAISRNISRALRLNEDLAETIALAHDLGHSPFGHKGEAALNRLMKGQGGFEPNRQVRAWRQAARTVEKECAQVPDECRRYFIIRCITDLQIRDVVMNAEPLIRQAGAASADDVRLQPRVLVQYGTEHRKLNVEL